VSVTGLQSRNLGGLRSDQRNEFFSRRLGLRIAIHESLNRNAIPLSRKIYRDRRHLNSALTNPT
jgi:hypothetical protein